MDPLSITASVVGLTTAALQSAQFLAKTIDNVKDAPVTIKEISADLRAVEPVLQSLKDTLENGSSQPALGDQIQPAVENCGRACEAFQSRIEHWMKHSKEDKIFWMYRWKIGLFGQERIKTFKGQLGDCKGTLNVALSTATLLAVTSQNDLIKEQKDSMLKAHEVDLQQELTRAGKISAEVEHGLQQLILGGSTKLDEASEQSKQELLQELDQQQSSNINFRKICEEALSTTVYQRTGQKIKGVKATNDSSALAGFINASGEGLKVNQDISDVVADNRSFAAAGVIGDLDFKDLCPR